MVRTVWGGAAKNGPLNFNSAESNQVPEQSSLHREHSALLRFREREVAIAYKKDLLIALNAISMQDPTQQFH